MAALFSAALFAHAEPVIPTGQGTTWEYEVVGNGPAGATPARLTVRVAGQEQIGERSAVKVETVAKGEVTKTELIVVDPRGILCLRRTAVGGKDASFDPPQMLVPLPLEANANWELDDTFAGTQMHQRWSVAGEEEVDVPAGKFKAFRLHCEQPWPLSIMIDRWFTRGIGMVKEVTTTRGPTGRLVNRLTTSLKKFSPTALATPIPTSTPTPAVTSTPTTAPSASASATPSETPVPTPEQTFAQTALSPPAFASPPPALRIKLEVSKDRDGPAGAEFKSDVPNIFVHWAGENLPVNSDVRVAWIAEDVGEVAPPNFVVDQTVTTITKPEFGARFTLSRPKDGWAPGKYRIELYLEEQLIDTASVTIQD